IPHPPLVSVRRRFELAPTTRALKFAVAPFPPHPQLQLLFPFVDLILVDLISRPSQHPRPLVLSSHLVEGNKNSPLLKPPEYACLSDSCVEPLYSTNHTARASSLR